MTYEPDGIASDDEESQHIPENVSRLFEWVWATVTGTGWGFIAFVVLIYVIPYGLAIAAFGTQVQTAGEFAVLGYAALFATSFASGQPAPTPLMGTASLLLAGFLGANFDIISVALVAGGASSLGLVTSYAAGATGIGRLLIDRLGDRPGVETAVERAFDVIRRRGVKAIFVLALIPTPIYAWSSVAAGASKLLFFRYLPAATIGSLIRFAIVALIGNGIEQLLS